LPESRAQRADTSTYALRVVGALLFIFVAIPFYRLATGADSDRIATDVVDAANVARTLLLLGTFISMAIGILVGRFVDAARLEARVARAGAWLASIRTPYFAAALALLSALLCLVFSSMVLEGKPNLIDAMVQLTQARYVAAGRLGGPLDPLSEFWHLPNSITTKAGWVSQYPPGHVVLLAVGMILGAPILVGPLLAGVAVFFTALTGDRLFPDDRAVGRLGALMLALSPFFLGLAGAYMNHVAAAAFISIAVYAAIRRAEGGSFAWAVLAGAATGAVFTIRPLTAIVTSLIVAVIWMYRANDGFSAALPKTVKDAGGAALGIAPFIFAIGAYNKHFFGSALRFGYSALVGPLVNPGFHRDPSGHYYGPLQAIEYTSSDLTTLSMYLLESLLPVVAIVALYLMLARNLSRDTRILVAWALLPVIANALYWHHGIFMGPRMLNEWAPAWTLLTAVAAAGLVRRASPTAQFRGYSLRPALIAAFIVAWLAGVLYLGPQRLSRYGGSYLASTRLTLPPPRSPSLVFVHGGWSSRIAIRLTAHGMRGDSLEAAMALNPTCDAHKFADWYASPPDSRGRSPAMNFDFGSGVRPPRIEIAQGDEIRYVPNHPLPMDCQAQVASDTLGIIDISPLSWQGDLPGLEAKGAMVVRDLGPSENAKLIARYPDRVPMMLLRRQKEGAPVLVPYGDGVRLLWPNG